MTTEVHLDWKGTTSFLGRLYAGKGSSVSFQYTPDWMAGDAFPIDPTSLPLVAGMHHSGTLFGAFQDCGPDRWGRLLIERAVRKKMIPQRPYSDLDYVLALDDSSRLGSLRFRPENSDTFVAATEGKIPPLIKLNTLLSATEAVHEETETSEHLRLLLGQGSPLGGARPKSSVVLPDGRLAIAKFPKPDDLRDIESGEILALTLARNAGIQVAQHQLISILDKQVAVITRFDRDGLNRIPFLSAATLLALAPGESGAYTMLAEGIRQFGGGDVVGDLKELWRRMIFSLLASNYDDHMRNHGFLMKKLRCWELSPAYDLNPVPEIDRARMPKTSVSETSTEPSIAEALKCSSQFGLSLATAKEIVCEVYQAVSDWRTVGRKLHLKASVLSAYESAFDHALMVEARHILGKK
jgi:serine/threonine-protein kinase HipA